MPLVELMIEGADAEEQRPCLGRSLRQLHAESSHCDVVLTCGGERFPAHRVALAATSGAWRERLLNTQDMEVPIVEVSQPEAVRIMIRSVYDADSLSEAYDPGTADINRAVLVLARSFELPALTEVAMHWLAKDVTTANVVEKLRSCREFRLDSLHARIIEELIGDRAALTEVSRSAQIARYPELMQALLQQAAAAASLEAQKACRTSPAREEKYGELDEKPSHQAQAGSGDAPAAEGEATESAASEASAAEATLEELVTEMVRSPMPVIRRRRSVGKQSEEVIAEVAAEEAAAVAEVVPKKRKYEKKCSGK